MSDYGASDDGMMRRYSRRLVNRSVSRDEQRLTGIPEDFPPPRPFQELYTPTQRDRTSMQLQFTPITPLGGTPRRLSLQAVKFPFSNRSIIVGTIVFLVLSAIYKSGIIGWVIRMKAAELNGSLQNHSSILTTDEVVPLSLYESTLSEVDHLVARLVALETFQSEFSQQCLLRDRRIQEEIFVSQSSFTDCMQSLEALGTIHSVALAECTDTIEQLEIEQIQVLDRIEADMESRITNLLNTKNTELGALEEQVVILETENIVLREQLELVQHQQILYPEVHIEEFSGSTPPLEGLVEEPVLMSEPSSSYDPMETKSIALDPIIGTEIEPLEKQPILLQTSVVVLSALVAILGVVSGILILERKSRNQTTVFQVSHSFEEVAQEPSSCQDMTAIEERDPCEEERMHMALEDMASQIAREVQAQLEVIEAQHEREMDVMRAIVDEVNRTTLEIGSLIKETIDETSIVSTCNNSACLSPGSDSCSVESSVAEPDSSSLSVLLESSVTPIRVPLKDRPAAAKSKNSLPPTCYSIASPSRRSNERRTKRQSGLAADSSSDAESDQFSVEDDSFTEKENFAHDMADIWENFKNQ